MVTVRSTVGVPLFSLKLRFPHEPLHSLQKLASDPRCKGMPLSSFLLKPMQRITRYRLLIRSVSALAGAERRDRRAMEALVREPVTAPATPTTGLMGQAPCVRTPTRACGPD